MILLWDVESILNMSESLCVQTMPRCGLKVSAIDASAVAKRTGSCQAAWCFCATWYSWTRRNGQADQQHHDRCFLWAFWGPSHRASPGATQGLYDYGCSQLPNHRFAVQGCCEENVQEQGRCHCQPVPRLWGLGCLVSSLEPPTGLNLFVMGCLFVQATSARITCFIDTFNMYRMMLKWSNFMADDRRLERGAIPGFALWKWWNL